MSLVVSTTEPVSLIRQGAEVELIKKSDILDETSNGIEDHKIVKQKDSRFESSVQHDETDIYNPKIY